MECGNVVFIIFYLFTSHNGIVFLFIYFYFFAILAASDVVTACQL
jgi:hypothetical protein